MAKNKKTPEKKKASKKLIVVVSVIVAVALIAGVAWLIYNSTPVQYNIAVNKIENGDLEDGFNTLIELAKRNDDYSDGVYSYENNYKDTNELLYNFAIELIELGTLEDKKSAYRMLEQTYGYKDTDSIAYYLWVEDVYDPEDEGTFEQADQFMQMIPENYDGPFAEEVAKYRNDVKKSVEELNRRKYEAAMDAEEEPQLY